MSNLESPLSKQWNKSSKGLSGELGGLLSSADIEQLFDTLAEWNTYLENHVPFFGDSLPAEEREP